MALKTEAAFRHSDGRFTVRPAGRPTLADGIALLQSGDAAGAVNVLKAVTSREPRNGRAWRNLGFGWIARSIGDVDRDGVPDFVTSAPTKNIGGQNAGRVYVYSTMTGKLIWSVDGKPGGQLGIGIEAAGDVNRDGIPDVVASAPGAGKAYIYSGRDGSVLVTMTAEDAADNFGRHVAGAGDVNGDGYADVIIRL